MDLSYILNELGEERDLYLQSAAPPIFQTSMFIFNDVESMRQSLAHESETHFYTRGNNPTTDILRAKLAALECAQDALVFGSGSAAIGAAVMANLKAGDHIICVQKPYSWTAKLLYQLLARFGVESTMIDGTSAENYEKALQPNTKILFLESPNSFTFEMQDIEAVVAIARKHGLLTIMDNSYASPLNQQPIALGVDIVAHSATKYISGHSDTVAGVICGSKAMMQKIFASEFMTLGGIISPFNAWLLLRGLRTLAIRMDRVALTTPAIVSFLEEHPKVKKVYYPFLESHPQHELAKKYIKKPVGQFSIELQAETIEQVEGFCNALKRFRLACSWGGYESLIFPACTLYGSENYQNPWLHWSLVRFYVGLEETEVLLKDLQQALEKL